MFVHIDVVFLINTLGLRPVEAGELIVPIMPKPGVMVGLSPAYTPAHLQGLTIHPDNALKFDFLIHKGDGNLSLDEKKQEYKKLVKYFLASLTVPDKDQWVNLSPYEHDRIIADNFGKTEMGRDLLGQDYLLKQITSSLMYPEKGLGKEFWDKVYKKAYEQFGGSTSLTINTFNKVWIIPDQAAVYESGNTVYILRNHLKVMLEEDYLAMEKNNCRGESCIRPINGQTQGLPLRNTKIITNKIIREIILPAIEREVNEGKNFAQLRQIYSGMILATWYKHALKESLLGKVYANHSKVQGVHQDPKNNEQIYQEYLKAFKKGVFNYIKEDIDKYTNVPVPRKYFSGGAVAFKGITDKGFQVATLWALHSTTVHTLSIEKNHAIKSGFAADSFKEANYIDRASIVINPLGTNKVAQDSAMYTTVAPGIIYIGEDDDIKRIISLVSSGSAIDDFINMFASLEADKVNINRNREFLVKLLAYRLADGLPENLMTALGHPQIVDSEPRRRVIFEALAQRSISRSFSLGELKRFMAVSRFSHESRALSQILSNANMADTLSYALYTDKDSDQVPLYTNSSRKKNIKASDRRKFKALKKNLYDVLGPEAMGGFLRAAADSQIFISQIYTGDDQYLIEEFMKTHDQLPMGDRIALGNFMIAYYRYSNFMRVSVLIDPQQLLNILLNDLLGYFNEIRSHYQLSPVEQRTAAALGNIVRTILQLNPEVPLSMEQENRLIEILTKSPAIGEITREARLLLNIFDQDNFVNNGYYYQDLVSSILLAEILKDPTKKFIEEKIRSILELTRNSRSVIELQTTLRLRNQEPLIDVISHHQQNLELSDISFRDGGNSTMMWPYAVSGMLVNAGKPQLLHSSHEPPQLKEVKFSDIPKFSSVADALPEASNMTFIGVKGRTMLLQNGKGRIVGIKLLTKSSYEIDEDGFEGAKIRSGENPGILLYEAQYMEYLRQVKQDGEFQVASDVPRPIAKNGGFLVRIRDLPQDWIDAFNNQQEVKDSRLALSRQTQYYTAFVYEASPEYFNYLPDPKMDDRNFDAASDKVLTDLFSLARHGIIHTTPISLYHNLIQQGREDQGRYVWMVDIIRAMSTRFGAGRLHAWTKAIDYANLREAGLADYAEFEAFGQLVQGKNSSHLRTVDRQMGVNQQNRDGYYLANYLGEYMLSYVLSLGFRMRERNELDWQAPEHLAEILKKRFLLAYGSFVNEVEQVNLNELAGLVDWRLMARQMAFFMHKDNLYASYFESKQHIPSAIYGADLKVYYPQDTTASRGWVKGKGWYFDEQNPDLGAVNGQLPLKELIKALYIFSGYSVASIADKAQGSGMRRRSFLATGAAAIAGSSSLAQEPRILNSMVVFRGHTHADPHLTDKFRKVNKSDLQIILTGRVLIDQITQLPNGDRILAELIKQNFVEKDDSFRSVRLTSEENLLKGDLTFMGDDQGSKDRIIDLLVLMVNAKAFKENFDEILKGYRKDIEAIKKEVEHQGRLTIAIEQGEGIEEFWTSNQTKVRENFKEVAAAVSDDPIYYKDLLLWFFSPALYLKFWADDEISSKIKIVGVEDEKVLMEAYIFLEKSTVEEVKFNQYLNALNEADQGVALAFLKPLIDKTVDLGVIDQKDLDVLENPVFNGEFKDLLLRFFEFRNQYVATFHERNLIIARNLIKAANQDGRVFLLMGKMHMDYLENILREQGVTNITRSVDHAMILQQAQRSSPTGGIDLNSANMAMTIKRDGKGVVLPLAQQDMAQLSRIEGFDPVIVDIQSVTNLPILNELRQKFQVQSATVAF